MPRQPQQMVVAPELDGASLAAAVHSLFGLSWSKARDWIGAGKVSVNGASCTGPRDTVRGGDRLELDVAARRPPTPLDQIDASIVFLDDHLVVVNKPPGLSTVPYEDERDTLDRLLRRCLSRRDSRAERSRPSRGTSLHVVHRLDRETSGLLVFARTHTAKTHIERQLREHTVHRRYLAIAHGEVQPCTQTVTSHLLADRGDGRRGSRERGARGALVGRDGSARSLAALARAPRRRSSGEGQVAVTHVEVLEHLRGATLIACRLETGRTHQIRIHLGELGHPLLGERVYAGELLDAVSTAPRLMLHAAELGLVHPATSRPVRWKQPMPSDMAEVLASLRAPAP
jgi:23S rRNA pseudouridine1911/1915/1917 synthase